MKNKVDPSDFAQFVTGYTETMLWANTYGPDEMNGDEDFRGTELNGEVASEIIEECANFLDMAIEVGGLSMAGGTIEWPYSEPDGASMAGHDFALTRNHHGAGFWDRGIGAVGDTLTDCAHSFGEAYFYIDDKGGVHYE